VNVWMMGKKKKGSKWIVGWESGSDGVYPVFGAKKWEMEKRHCDMRFAGAYMNH